MINKQNLWFITLFSLILVLGIYYVSMKDEDVTLANVLKETNQNESEDATVSVTEADSLAALRVAEDESILSKMEEYQNVLLNASSTAEEKSSAYDNLQSLSTKKSKKEDIEKIIKEKFSLSSFVKIDQDQINITIASSKHSTELANNIIREVQKNYQDQKYITVKFQ
jgi:stage III sporulation protein AH